MSCPVDRNVISIEGAEISTPIISDLHQLYSGLSVEAVPIIIGHTGVVTVQYKEDPRIY